MATTISIKVGNLTAERTFANDAKSAEALRLYAERRGIGPDATNKQKLQFIVDQIVEAVQREAKAQFLAEREREQADAAQAIGLE